MELKDVAERLGLLPPISLVDSAEDSIRSYLGKEENQNELFESTTCTAIKIFSIIPNKSLFQVSLVARLLLHCGNQHAAGGREKLGDPTEILVTQMVSSHSKFQQNDVDDD